MESKKTKPQKEKVSISLDKDVLDGTKKLAGKDDRGLSNYINLVLKRNIEKNGK